MTPRAARRSIPSSPTSPTPPRRARSRAFPLPPNGSRFLGLDSLFQNPRGFLHNQPGVLYFGNNRQPAMYYYFVHNPRLGTWRGQHWVGHSGATSGYRANLVRYTDAGVSVAVLCNRGDADPEGMSDSVAGALVPFGARDTANSPVRVSVPAAALADKAGLYRNLRDMRAQRLRVRDGKLENENGIELVPIDRAGTTFQAARGGMKIVFARRPDGHYNARTASRTADTVAVDWVADADTGRAALAAYAGQYESPEAETTVRVALDSTGSLAMTRLAGTPGGPWPMKPIYRDGFEMVPGVPVFTRDSGGKIDGFRFTTGRVRNLRFNRSAP